MVLQTQKLIWRPMAESPDRQQRWLALVREANKQLALNSRLARVSSLAGPLKGYIWASPNMTGTPEVLGMGALGITGLRSARAVESSEDFKESHGFLRETLQENGCG